MKNIKITLQFDGSRYSGWQKLGNTDNTIQGKLESLLEKMTNEDISLIGSSRTDKGVHSKGFACNFHTESSMGSSEIEEYINRYLPDDIRAIEVTEEPERFHCQYNAKSKLYRYSIDNGKYQDVFTRKYTSHIPDPLDIERMQKAADLLVGSFDFAAYTNMKSKTKSTVRTILSINIKKEGNYIHIDYEGDGFLYNMIRIITGTLVRVGKKELEPQEVLDILAGKDRSVAGPMVEAKGLCLMEVRF